jgi:hypothetical protein
MRAPTIALLVGLTLLAIGLAFTLLGSPLSVAGTNRPPGRHSEPIVMTNRSASYCQGQQLIPHGTSAIRVWLDAATGPRVRLAVSAGGRPLLTAQRGSGWAGGSVTVPVKPLERTIAAATVCVSFRLSDETVTVQGEAAPPAGAARSEGLPLRGTLWIEYLRPGRRSWASLASTVVRHMGLGRAAPGDWIVFLALALMAGAVALGCALIHREIR